MVRGIISLLGTNIYGCETVCFFMTEWLKSLQESWRSQLEDMVFIFPFHDLWIKTILTEQSSLFGGHIHCTVLLLRWPLCAVCVHRHPSNRLPLQRAGRRSSWCWRARPGCTLGLGCLPRAAGWGVHKPNTDLWAPGWRHSSAVGSESRSCQLTAAVSDK